VSDSVNLLLETEPKNLVIFTLFISVWIRPTAELQ